MYSVIHLFIYLFIYLFSNINYPLVNKDFALENDHRNSWFGNFPLSFVSFPDSVPPVLIHFWLGFSIINQPFLGFPMIFLWFGVYTPFTRLKGTNETIHFGYPHGYGTPHWSRRKSAGWQMEAPDLGGAWKCGPTSHAALGIQGKMVI